MKIYLAVENVAVNFLFRSYVILNFIATIVTSSANFYNELTQGVSTASISKTMKGVSPTQCLLRCRRSKECKYAAMRQLNGTVKSKECLQLRDIDGGKVEVTLLKETLLEEILIPGKPRHTVKCFLILTLIFEAIFYNYSKKVLNSSFKRYDNTTVARNQIQNFQIFDGYLNLIIIFQRCEH